MPGQVAPPTDVTDQVGAQWLPMGAPDDHRMPRPAVICRPHQRRLPVTGRGEHPGDHRRRDIGQVDQVQDHLRGADEGCLVEGRLDARAQPVGPVRDDDAEDPRGWVDHRGAHAHRHRVAAAIAQCRHGATQPRALGGQDLRAAEAPPGAGGQHDAEPGWVSGLHTSIVTPVTGVPTAEPCDDGPVGKKDVALKAAIGAVAVGGSAAAGTAAASLTAAAYFARRVLTPDRRRPDDVEILQTGVEDVLFAQSPEAVVPGRYGVWLEGGRGHIRVGEILEHDAEAQTVRRRILSHDYGILRPGPARWNAYYYASPPELSLGLATRHVHVPTELGPMPAWVIPGMGDGTQWAILVHGRGARREETVRAISPVLAARHTVLVPSYRNDEGAPAGPDGRYNLGLSEWRDIEAAITYAVECGARELALVGWSMGGAIVLQLLAQSPLASVVTRVVLDGPVVDWNDVLAHHARAHGVPERVGGLSRTLMGRRWTRRLVGVHESVDVAKTNWVARAAELRHPMLLIHSRDDEFVPVGPSEALAAARPDLVTFVPWAQARHCKEWNTDPARWEGVVTAFLRQD